MVQISESIERKFISSIDISSDGWEIESDTGFEPLTHINKTIEYTLFEVSFSCGKSIKCADDHIFITADGQQIFAKDSIDTYIKTKEGSSKVVNIINHGTKESMYDLSVDSKDHTYYSDGILSHNSTTIAAFFCWLTIFHPHKECAILANKASVAREILSRFQKAYENLPKFLQQGVVSWNKGSVELENGSKVLASSTSSSAIRGYTINYLFLDEFAFVNQNIAEDFFTSVWPTISSGKTSQITICSTPNGFNHFYKLWNEAEQGLNGFNPIFVDWTKHPDRDEAWKQEQLKVLGEDKFAQENMAEFLGSSNTLIHSRNIKVLSPKRPQSSSDNARIYADPVVGRNYLIVCDPARGTGNDSSAFIVFDITEYPITIAAVYQDENVSPLVLPTLLDKFGLHYNSAWVLVEINDNGQQVADILWKDLEYENFVVFGGFTKKTQYGIRTTASVKRRGCTHFKDMIESQKILINDVALIQEISNFVSKKGSYSAATGYHDDLVMCCVLLSFFATTEDFDNISDNSYKKEMLQQNLKAIEEELLPFGFIDDGIDDSSEDKEFWETSGDGWFTY